MGTPSYSIQSSSERRAARPHPVKRTLWLLAFSTGRGVMPLLTSRNNVDVLNLTPPSRVRKLDMSQGDFGLQPLRTSSPGKAKHAIGPSQCGEARMVAMGCGDARALGRAGRARAAAAGY